MGLTRIGGNELGHTLPEDAPRAGRTPADELVHRKLQADRASTPGEIRQAALTGVCPAV